MSEVVIVIPDLYFPSDLGPRDSAEVSGFAQATGSPSLVGLERIARFGHRRTLEAEGGWRPWLARMLGRRDIADVPPAAIAAAGLTLNPDTAEKHASASQLPGPTLWIASPLHLIAGLTSLHLDRRSLLRLPTAEAERFAADFNQSFGDPDPAVALRLHPLPSGEFLLQAPANFEATTTEPARALVEGLESSLPRGPRATAFKRLGAELEMWLHAHPLNEARRRRGALPVSALWLWGGGPISGQLSASASARDPVSPAVSPSCAHISTSSPQPVPPVIALGSDPYLVGLTALSSTAIRAIPDFLVAESSQARRVVLVSEVTALLHANPQRTVIDAVADLDHRFISPALAALDNGRFETVTLIANHLEIRLSRSDRFKFWRARQPGLTGLIPR